MRKSLIFGFLSLAFGVCIFLSSHPQKWHKKEVINGVVVVSRDWVKTLEMEFFPVLFGCLAVVCLLLFIRSLFRSGAPDANRKSTR